MSWEIRGDNRYYYSRKKVEGKTTRRYIGCGAYAELIADLERAGMETERWKRRHMKAVEHELDQIGNLADSLEAFTLSVQKSALARAGYFNHRGEWRKRRLIPAAATPSSTHGTSGLARATTNDHTTSQTAPLQDELATTNTHDQ